MRQNIYKAKTFDELERFNNNRRITDDDRDVFRRYFPKN